MTQSRIVTVSLAVSAVVLLSAQIAGPAFAEEIDSVPSVEAPSPEPSPESGLAPEPTSSPDELPAPEDEAQVSPTLPPEEPPVEEVIGHLTVTPMQAYPGEKVHVTGQCKIWGHGPTDVWLDLYTNDDINREPAFSEVKFDESTGLFDTEVTLSKTYPPGKYRLAWMCAVDDQIFASSDVDPTFTVLGTTTPPIKKPTPSPRPGDEKHPSPVDPSENANPSPPAELAKTGSSEHQSMLLFSAGMLAVGGAGFVAASRRSRGAARASFGN